MSTHAPAVITGATGTLGRAVAQAFAHREVPLVLVGRSRPKLEALARELAVKTDLVVADLGDVQQVKRAAKEIAFLAPVIGVLVNNAAVFHRQRVDRGGLEEMFATNHLAGFILTTLLQPQLVAGRAHVINVTAPSSTRLDFDDLQWSKRYSALSAFGASKAANLLFSFEAARQLKGTGVTVDAFHPGLMKSGLMKEAPWFIRAMMKLVAASGQKAAEALVEAALAPGVDGHGRFLKSGVPSAPPASTLDVKAQKRLWDVSRQLAS